LERLYAERVGRSIFKGVRHIHEDPIIEDALNKAALGMNRSGLNIFSKAVLRMHERKCDFESTEDGVREHFSNGYSCEYVSSRSSCLCHAFTMFEICRHVLYKRLVLQLPLYDEEDVPISFLDVDTESWSPPTSPTSSPSRMNLTPTRLSRSPKSTKLQSPRSPSPGLKSVLEEERQAEKKKKKTASAQFTEVMEVGKEIATITSYCSYGVFQKVHAGLL